MAGMRKGYSAPALASSSLELVASPAAGDPRPRQLAALKEAAEGEAAKERRP